MEERKSPEHALAPEPEQIQHSMESSSQALPEHEGDASLEKLEDADKGPGEFKKTWGFRRTTIAKREMPGDPCPEAQEGRGAPVRRSGRQAKRTDKLEEFLLTAKRGRGAGRRSAPPHLEGGDPPSQTPTDAETASEASFDGNAEAKGAEGKEASPERKRGKRKGSSVSDDGSSENDEEEEVTKEAQKDVDGQEGASEIPVQQEQESVKTDEEEKADKEAQEKAVAPSPKRPARESTSTKRSGAKHREEDEESSSSSSSSSDSENDYDPNTLYCICRQKHNKRFMICCDRCEEWFHGDCVGITEARGRLMERNGEDYVCPNCTALKGQAARAPAAALRRGGSTAADERTSEDLGIKGRIEKATNPSGKKKIKIFQPQALEDSALPKCIGPGCERTALPESVYCGNDCILRHAAAAMRSITDVKDPKQKEKSKAKAQKGPATRSTPKKSLTAERRASRKSTESSSRAEEEEEESASEEEEDEEQHTEEHPPPAAVSSWSSDHNYNAVTPEKTTPIAPSVLNKSCMYLFEGLSHLILSLSTL